LAFRWKGSEPPAAAGPTGGTTKPRGSGGGAGEEHPSLAFAYALERTLKETRAQVLDLGVLCGQTATFLAERGARVVLDEFDPPPPRPAPAKGEKPLPAPPIHFEQAEAAFDLVLAWEMPDFVPPDQIALFAKEVRRVLKPGGWLLLFAHLKPGTPTESPPRYRVVAEDRVVREPSTRPPRIRHVHATRDLERALSGFSIQKTHLQRNQMREIVALKVIPKPG
jgi:SAM-dependent methyltransferase